MRPDHVPGAQDRERHLRALASPEHELRLALADRVRVPVGRRPLELGEVQIRLAPDAPVGEVAIDRDSAGEHVVPRAVAEGIERGAHVGSVHGDVVDHHVERTTGERGRERGGVGAIGDEVLDPGGGGSLPRESTVTAWPAATS